MSNNEQLPTIDPNSMTSASPVPSPSPQPEHPSLEEARQALLALAMGGQTLMEVRNDYITVRDALLALNVDARRYRWIREQSGRPFELISSGVPWFNENGKRYTCAFNLHIRQVGYHGRERLDDLMDEVMADFPMEAE